MKKITKNFKIEVKTRIPVSRIGVVCHKPKKGKGSYSRKKKNYESSCVL